MLGQCALNASSMWGLPGQHTRLALPALQRLCGTPVELLPDCHDVNAVPSSPPAYHPELYTSRVPNLSQIQFENRGENLGDIQRWVGSLAGSPTSLATRLFLSLSHNW